MNFIRKTIPHHLEEDVAIDQPIEILFFIDIFKGSIKPERIILFNLTGERSESIEYTYENRSLAIKPKEALSPNAHYQVQIVGGKEGIMDITGRTLEETYVLEFYTKKTKQIQPPVMTSPTDLTEITDDIAFEWEAAENAVHYELEISKSNAFHNLVWPPTETPVYETEVTPHINYEEGTYYARIRSVDADGKKSNYSKPIRYYYNGPKQDDQTNQKNHGVVIEAASREVKSFSQLDALQSHFSNEQGSQAPTNMFVVDSEPKHKTMHLSSIGDKITLTFSQKIDPASVTNRSVYIIKEQN